MTKHDYEQLDLPLIYEVECSLCGDILRATLTHIHDAGWCTAPGFTDTFCPPHTYMAEVVLAGGTI